MTTAIETRLPKQVQNASAKARQILEEQRVKREKLIAPPGVELIENPEVAIPSLNTAPQPDPVETDRQDLAYWKHRAQTLDGALKSAKGKHATLVSDLNSQIATLQDQLRESKDALAASTPIKLDDYFTQEEVDALGETEARIMASKLAATKRDAVKATRAEFQVAQPAPKPPVPAVVEDEPPSEEEEFYKELDRLVPNWEKINRDKRWLNHCGTRDESTGLRIQDLLNTAKERLNAPAAAKLFRDFEKSLNVVETPPPAIAPDARNAGGREPPSPPAPASANGRPSQDEIAEHFKNRKLYFHRPEHPKHIPEDRHKAFLARLQPAA